MTTVACTYAALRFLPYRETGEFANIGVVVCAPEAGYFAYRCDAKLAKRVTGFFPELDRAIFRDAVRGMTTLLERLRPQLARKAIPGESIHADLVNRFHELARTREGMLSFAPAGALLAPTPEAALDDLHRRLVLRQFAKEPEYQERILRKRLADCLRTWKLETHYRQAMIGNEEFHVSVPFVHAVEGRPRKILRPLDLNRPDTTSIYRHSDQWLLAMRRLRQFGTLPEKVIIPVHLPDDEPLARAARQAMADFTEFGAQAIPFGDEAALHRAAEVA